MLEIRREQLHTLTAARIDSEDGRAFVDSLVAWTRDAYWEAMLGRNEAYVRALVRSIVLRALDHGLDRIEYVREFVELELAHGPDFDRRTPYVARTFADPRLPPGAKLGLARQRLVRR